MQYKAAIFDMDGTLIDSTWVWDQVDHTFQELLNFRVRPDYYEQISHMTTTESACYTISEYNLDITPDNLKALWIEIAYEIYAHQITLKQGVPELIEELKKIDVKVGIATSCFRNLCEVVLKSNHVYHIFDAITFSDEIGVGKHKPDIYLSCAHKLGVPPAQCAVFEDIHVPLEGVKSVGMGYFGVQDRQTDHVQQLLQRDADYYIREFDEFVQHKVYLHYFG